MVIMKQTSKKNQKNYRIIYKINLRSNVDKINNDILINLYKEHEDIFKENTVQQNIDEKHLQRQNNRTINRKGLENKSKRLLEKFEKHEEAATDGSPVKKTGATAAEVEEKAAEHFLKDEILKDYLNVLKDINGNVELKKWMN